MGVATHTFDEGGARVVGMPMHQADIEEPDEPMEPKRKRRRKGIGYKRKGVYLRYVTPAVSEAPTSNGAVGTADDENCVHAPGSSPLNAARIDSTASCVASCPPAHAGPDFPGTSNPASSSDTDTGSSDSDADTFDSTTHMCRTSGETSSTTPNVHLVNTFSDQSRRIAIAYYYVNGLGAPAPDQWAGKMGTVSKIRKALNMSPGSTGTILNVLRDVFDKRQQNLVYTGASADTPMRVSRRRVISADSAEAQIIADTLELGLGVREAQLMVNDYRQSLGKSHLGVTTIYKAYIFLKGKTVPILYAKQGSSDVTSPWAVARLNWTKQLAIRLGVLVWDHLAMGAPPSQLDLANPDVTPLALEQIVHWDECHIKQVVGFEPLGPVVHQVLFDRDDLGRLDADGELREPTPQAKLKFPKEARCSFGCAAVKTMTGQVEGRRCEVFFYSNRWMVNVEEWETLKKAENERVKSLTGPSKLWITGARSFGDEFVLYECDGVELVQGIGKVLGERLREIGLVLARDVARISDADLPHVAASLHGISFARLDTLRQVCRSAQPGTYPETSIDHRKASEPYKSRFPDDHEAKIAASGGLAAHVCVTELVRHIYRASAAVMVGTVYEDDWRWYHDALPQLTAKCTVDWMRANGFLAKMVRPDAGLNAGTVYAARPVGNSPELMCWDCSLNKDVNDALKRHVAYTTVLDKHDARKFSKATPKSIESALTRIMDPALGPGAGVPSGRRIVQDIKKSMGPNLLAVIATCGAVVPGAGDRNGRRRIPSGRRGGHHVKLAEYVPTWLHDDAKDGRRELLSRSVMLWKNNVGVV